MTGHKATPEQWAQIEAWMEIGSQYSACVLELRDRIEALEARRPASKIYEINEPLKLTPRQQEEIAALLRPNSKPSPNSSQIGRSLVERVQGAQMESVKEWGPMARAAIREVAAWLDENTGGDAAWILTQEAER